MLFVIEEVPHQFVTPVFGGLAPEWLDNMGIVGIVFSFSKQYSHMRDAGKVLEHVLPRIVQFASGNPRIARIMDLVSVQYCIEHVERTDLDLGEVILIAPGDEVAIQFVTVDAECGQTIGELARLLVNLAARE